MNENDDLDQDDIDNGTVPLSSRRAPTANGDKRISIDPYDYESIFAPDAPMPRLRDRINIKAPRVRKRLIVGVIAVALIAAAFTTYQQFYPSGSPGEEVQVEIAKGATTAQVAKQLDKKGVVSSALAFRIAVKLDSDFVLQAGEYNFRLNSSTAEALSVLDKGPKQHVEKLVIPEGFRLTQIADRVGKLPGMSTSRFLELARGETIRSDYQPSEVKSIEGFLFPDTYLIGASDNEETLLRRMVDLFDTKARLAGIDDSERKIGHSPYETLIIASMIEAEAKVDEDRGKISQVIENRLFKDMPLQIDATILYALGNNKQSLSNNDLKVDSQYNTYTHKGLPPRAINNPGSASLKAALEPTPGPWLYYVIAAENGAHAFGTTLDEHNANVREAKKKGLL